jgi:DnaJ-class molecular chaperone
MRDPYQVLGVGKTASADQIKAAYRKLAKTLHPDLNPGNKKVEERFKEVSAAYDMLSDLEKKRRYDAGEIDASGAERPQHAYYRTYADGRRGGKYREQMGAEGFGFEDLINDLFRGTGAGMGPGGMGGRGRGPGGRAPGGQDVAYTLNVPFLDAVNGGTMRLTLASGKTLDVTIPVNAKDGEVMRLKGQGAAAMPGGPMGDALVTLSIEAHAHFRREGDDVVLEVPVTLQEAVLGAKIEVPTLDGRVAINVPKGANTGTRLRLRERGARERKTGKRGDLYVALRVVLPEGGDAELEAFAAKWGRQYEVRKKAGI